MPDRLMSTAQVADRLGLGVDWVQRHASELGVFRLPGGLKFRPSDIDAWEARHYAEPVRGPQPPGLRQPRRLRIAPTAEINVFTGAPFGAPPSEWKLAPVGQRRQDKKKARRA